LRLAKASLCIQSFGITVSALQAHGQTTVGREGQLLADSVEKLFFHITREFRELQVHHKIALVRPQECVSGPWLSLPALRSSCSSNSASVGGVFQYQDMQFPL
jgi:hypothetical protein